MTLTELDPVTIREELEHQRSLGVPFDQAWLLAINGCRRTVDNRSVYAFMRKNFEAAYYDRASPLGRFTATERDTSNAVLIRREHALVPLNHDRCRSGDGCDRLAIRGRFGKMWCDHHGAELERLSVKLHLDLEAANPRNNGNTSLFTHQAAA